MVYKTKGTCSSEIEFEVENGILTDIHFVGGCQGNTTGVAALAKGLPIDEVIDKLSGIQLYFPGIRQQNGCLLRFHSLLQILFH